MNLKKTFEELAKLCAEAQKTQKKSPKLDDLVEEIRQETGVPAFEIAHLAHSCAENLTSSTINAAFKQLQELQDMRKLFEEIVDGKIAVMSAEEAGEHEDDTAKGVRWDTERLASDMKLDQSVVKRHANRATSKCYDGWSDEIISDEFEELCREKR